MPAPVASDPLSHPEEIFDLPAYLRRIGVDRPVPLTVAGLASLVRAHRMAIAFENLDILLGRGISLAPRAVFDKLVHHRRGGYCFEQNALFDRALGALGFTGRPLMGRVWFRAEEDVTPPRTHQLQLVVLDGQPWIADVGFGGSLTPPLPLVEGESEPDGEGLCFRLRRDEAHGWMLERRGAPRFMDISGDEASRWQVQYSFTTDLIFDADREMGNHWTSTRPDTRFTTAPIAHRITETGFASLSGHVLKVRREGETDMNILSCAMGLQEALEQYFHMRFDREEAERLFSAC